MATVDIDLVINTANSANSVSDIRKQMKALKSAMLEVGEDSAEFDKLANAAAQLEDKMDAVNGRMKAFNPDGFAALTGFASKAAGAVSAVTGAMTLFGVESEDTQKALMKVQSAMALTQGLDAIKGLGEAFNNLKAVGVKAFSAIKTAIGSTGIGLLVIALGAVVAYWDDIKAAVSGVSKEQKKLLADTQATAEAAKDQLDAVSEQENILKLSGMSEREILELKIAQTKETITALEAQLVQQEAMKKSQVEAAERNKNILKGILDVILFPIKMILSTIDLVTEKMHDWGLMADDTFESVGNLSERFTTSIAEMVFDPEEVASEADAAIQETKDKLTELKNNQAGFQLQINAIDKAGYEERKKIRDQEEADAEAQWQAELDRMQALTDAMNADEARRAEEKKLAQEKDLKEHQEYLAIKREAEQKEHDRRKREHEEEQAMRLQNIKASLDAAAGLFNALGQLAGKNAKLQKGFAVAEALVNTYKGVTAALAQPLPTPINFINAAAILAAGLANVKKILSTNPGSGASGGGGAPSMSGGGGVAAINTPPAQPQPSTQLDQNGNVIGSNGQQQQPEPMRVYVVESDITRTQSRVAVAEQAVSYR